MSLGSRAGEAVRRGPSLRQQLEGPEPGAEGSTRLLHPTGLHPIGQTQLEGGGPRSFEMCSEQIRPLGSGAGQEGH